VGQPAAQQFSEVTKEAMITSKQEIERGERFAFGANWTRFLATLDESRIVQAERTLCEMLRVDDLQGKSFLDIGSGSGLFSLAARRLGAQVHSFDFDDESVACTEELKRRYFPGDDTWTVEQGSVLDNSFLAKLGQWDVVYSWGVLHHTGAMWKALDNAGSLVAADGALYIAIYNDQGYKSRHWAKVKKAYNEHPWSQPILLAYGLVRGWGLSLLVDLVKLRPFKSWRDYHAERGMSAWHDNIDWVGGYPFEVATPEAIFKFYRERGFQLTNLITRQGWGCNEFAFQKTLATSG
jgi:2-polyprenyl-6-hydroxyphenyl methylase/3-demethylubiquinone-9 3-methyltransferase